MRVEQWVQVNPTNIFGWIWGWSDDVDDSVCVDGKVGGVGVTVGEESKGSDEDG